jgi:hypothetical protein
MILEVEFIARWKNKNQACFSYGERRKKVHVEYINTGLFFHMKTMHDFDLSFVVLPFDVTEH